MFLRGPKIKGEKAFVRRSEQKQLIQFVSKVTNLFSRVGREVEDEDC